MKRDGDKAVGCCCTGHNCKTPKPPMKKEKKKHKDCVCSCHKRQSLVQWSMCCEQYPFLKFMKKEKKHECIFKCTCGAILDDLYRVPRISYEEAKKINQYTLPKFSEEEVRIFNRELSDEELKLLLPKRIQRKRTKGWRMPSNTVYVGRPTKWGNPYIIKQPKVPGGDLMIPMKPIEAVVMFKKDLTKGDKKAIKTELRGKNLACFCPLDQPCHADVLLKIANS